LIFSSSIISAVFWFLNRHNAEQSISFSFYVVLAPCLLAILIIGGTHFANYIIGLRKTEVLINGKLKKEEISSI